MICHKLKVIFIHIPRTAGTSLEMALIGKNWWHVDPATKHLTCSQARDIYADYWADYLKITIVRNPWDWLVSLYSSAENIRSDGQRISWYDYVTSPQLASHEQKTVVQSEIIGDEIEYILKYENFEQDFRHLCVRLGIDPPVLPHLVTQSGRLGDNYKHYSHYYDAYLRDVVASRHADDIRRFNYSY